MGSPSCATSPIEYWPVSPKAKRPEITRYLEAENAYTQALPAPLQPLQEQLVKKMHSRIREDSTPPVNDTGWWYWREFKTGVEYRDGVPNRILQFTRISFLLMNS